MFGNEFDKGKCKIICYFFISKLYINKFNSTKYMNKYLILKCLGIIKYFD